MSPASRPQIAVMVSGSGTNLQAIIDAIEAGRLPVDIRAVISDVPDALGLERAARSGLATRVVDFRGFADRGEFDAALDATLTDLAPDLIVLAGYMRIIADGTVTRFTGRMLNVHPSLLPAYPGLHTYRRALEAGERWHGTTVHYVIPELDAGPPLIQYRVAVRPDDTEQSLRERVQQGEYLIYPRAIGWIAAGRAHYEEGRVMLDGTPLQQPVIVNESADK